MDDGPAEPSSSGAPSTGVDAVTDGAASAAEKAAMELAERRAAAVIQRHVRKHKGWPSLKELRALYLDEEARQAGEDALVGGIFSSVVVDKAGWKKKGKGGKGKCLEGY